MSISTHQSPSSSDVLPYYSPSLSPPPPPRANKRPRLFQFSQAASMEVDIPTFLPSSSSISSSISSSKSTYDKGKENMESRRLLSLSSRPIPSIRLKPRPTLLNADMMIEKDTKLSIKIEDIPSLPFSFSNTSTTPTSSEFGNIESIQALPSLAVSKNSSSSSDSSPVKSKSESSPLGANEKKDKTTAANTEDGQQVKLPSFQKTRLQYKAKRRNSLVARTA